MSNIKRFSSRKEVTEFLATKGLDTSNWSEEKWLSINKGQAEIHMMMLSEKVYDAIQESVPIQLKPNEWHIPFANKISLGDLDQVKVSVAMAARTSYTVVGEEKEIDYEAMIKLHDRLLAQDPPHSSPFEHTCQVVSEEEYNKSFKGEEKGWFRNYKGFKSYRQIVEENK